MRWMVGGWLGHFGDGEGCGVGYFCVCAFV